MIDTKASVAKTLFLGKLLHTNILPYPRFAESERETLRMVIDSIDRFMEERVGDFPRFDREGVQPEAFISALKELGLFGLIIPEEHGGLGLSNAGYSRVLQQLARHDGSTALTVGAHSSIGMKGILLFGNDEQKSRYLPRLASGELVAAFCLTEPGSGSDAASIKTNAEKQPDGSWKLNGQKIWITNGAFAGLFTVFARTDSEGGQISAFIVERNLPGISIGHKEDKMGIRASATTTVSFDNVILPPDSLLGTEGKGFKIAMSILNNGRTGLGGGCVGGMKRSIALASAYATTRKQFGRPIAEFGLVKEKLARMSMWCFATEAVVHMVGHYIDSGVEDYSLEAAISKVFASEALWNCSNEALQIAGGNGFMKEYPYEMIVRDARINLIFEGTNEILRLFIALTGAKEAGDYLKRLGRGMGDFLSDPIKGFGLLSDYASRRFSFLSSLGRERIPDLPSCLRESEEVYLNYAGKLAVVTEGLLRRYKKEITEEQMKLRRLADITIDLFVGLCVVSRVASIIKERGEDQSQTEIALLKLFTHEASLRIKSNLEILDANEDDSANAVAGRINSEQSYPWDTL